MGGICLLVGMLFAENTQAQTVWLDSLYVRVADAEVQRPSNGDVVVIFDIEVFRPVKEWNNNDTTLGSSDFVFAKREWIYVMFSKTSGQLPAFGDRCWFGVDLGMPFCVG